MCSKFEDGVSIETMRSFRVMGVTRRAVASLVSQQQQRRLVESEACADDGAGDSGRNAGSIREAGGRFAEIGSSRENVYFRKVDSELIQKLKERRHQEIERRKEEIKMHEKAIDEAKRELEELDKRVEDVPPEQ